MARRLIFRLLAIVLAVGGPSPAEAQQPQALANMPSADATLKYLNQTIVWYRHIAEQEQFAVDSSDTMFRNDDRQVSKQILRAVVRLRSR